MKKVLIITYYWPPSGGSGVQRWMYFSKYLPPFGVEPIVLTVSEKHASYKNLDQSFLDEIKNIEVHKTRTFEPLKLYSLLTTGNSKKGIPQGHVGTHKKGIFYKFSAYIRANYFVPDARIGWNYFAIKKARKIIKSKNIDLIITSGPPHSTHLIGLKLKKEFNIKWIADFRDPWIEIYYNEHLNKSIRTKSKEALLETEVLMKADLILTVGQELKKMLQNKLVNKDDKFEHIYNGYDSVLMDNVQSKPHNHFEITYVGTMSSIYPYMELIELLKNIVNLFPDLNVKVCLAGNIEKLVLTEFYNSFHNSKLIINNYVSHKDAIQLMKSSQLLINLLAEMKDNQILISGKLMEYIATENPILCIGNTKGEAATLLSEINNTLTIEKNDIQNGIEFIANYVKLWKDKKSINKTSNNRIFEKSRIETSKTLSNIIKNI